MIVPFTPRASSSAPPFQFQATLDGSLYTVTVTWNLFGQRYYINVYSLDGDRMLTTAMVGSAAGYPVNLVDSQFGDSTLVFWQDLQQFEILP